MAPKAASHISGDRPDIFSRFLKIFCCLSVPIATHFVGLWATTIRHDGGFVGETGFSRLILRAVSLMSAVGGIVAVSGIDYYAQQFYDYLFLGLCGLWSLINIGLLLFKHPSHPGYCILFDMLLVAASAFLVTVSGVGAAFKGYDLIGRGIAAVVFAAVEFVVHFVLFMLACSDFHARRRKSSRKLYRHGENVNI